MGSDGFRWRGPCPAMARAPEREPDEPQAPSSPPLHRDAALFWPGEDDHPAEPPGAHRRLARLGCQPLRCRRSVGMILLEACGALVLTLGFEQLVLRLVELSERVVRLSEICIGLGRCLE